VNQKALSPEDRAIFERIAAVRAGVRTGAGGPFGILMHVPGLADRAAALEDYFRFDAALPAADRELVVLATVREMGARYPWVRHEVRAHEEGTRVEAVEAVRTGAGLEDLKTRERLLVEIVRALLRTRSLSEELFTRALAELGRRQLIETVALTGHYNLVGLITNAFDVPPPDEKPTF
jgi:4-carboxymuconolactone decarboxylase